MVSQSRGRLCLYLNSLPLELVYEMVLYLTYEQILVLCEIPGFKNYRWDPGIWLFKAKYNYGINRTIYQSFEEYKTYPYKQYLQVVSNISEEFCTYGSEQFIHIGKCLYRAGVLGDRDLIDYFLDIARNRKMFYLGTDYWQNILIKGILNGGHLLLYSQFIGMCQSLIRPDYCRIGTPKHVTCYRYGLNREGRR